MASRSLRHLRAHRPRVEGGGAGGGNELTVAAVALAHRRAGETAAKTWQPERLCPASLRSSFDRFLRSLRISRGPWREEEQDQLGWEHADCYTEAHFGAECCTDRVGYSRNERAGAMLRQGLDGG